MGVQTLLHLELDLHQVVSLKRKRSMDHKDFRNMSHQLLEDNMVIFVKKELKKIHKLLSPHEPEDSPREDEEVLDGDVEQSSSIREAFVKMTVEFLRRMEEEELADCLQSKHLAPVCRSELRSNLKKKFQCVFEGIGELFVCDFVEKAGLNH